MGEVGESIRLEMALDKPPTGLVAMSIRTTMSTMSMMHVMFMEIDELLMDKFRTVNLANFIYTPRMGFSDFRISLGSLILI